MHNAYCDADENSLDLRIHPKQHTTCASVRGKRSRSYNYGYVVLVLSYIHHHRQRKQAPWAPKADMSITNWRVYPARAILIASQVITLLRYSSLVARSGFPEGTSRASAAARYQMDLTNQDWRDVLQRQTDRLITLLLPLTYDRELKDLIFFYKCLFNHIYLASIPAIWINNFFNNFIWFIT